MCLQAAEYLQSNKNTISATSISKCSRMRLVGENRAMKVKPWDPQDVCPEEAVKQGKMTAADAGGEGCWLLPS